MTPEDEEFNRIEREADMRLQAVSAALQNHAARPVVPDALTRQDGESPEYMAGWNDCRAEMLRGRKV
jgi:predicted component of type VI protein secretion system